MTLFPSSNDSCPMCNGIKTNGYTTYTVDNGTGVVVIRNKQKPVVVNFCFASFRYYKLDKQHMSLF